jgi:hypothetical protein
MRFLTQFRSEKQSDPAERRRGHGPSRRRATVRPRLEMLEERRVLSTLTVTSNSDSSLLGVASLRAEIAAAQPGDTIVFDPSLDGQTITLGGDQLEINKNLTIQGPGASLLTISGGDQSRVFGVDAGANVTISGLTIRDGDGRAYAPYTGNVGWGSGSDMYDGAGGGILNLGTMALSGCTVTNNHASGPCDVARVSVGGGIYIPAGSVGGGIYNNGTMTLSSGSIVTGNTAYDYVEPTYGTVLPGAGGGIFNGTQGHLTILSSVVSKNTASDGADICNLGSITISKDSSIGSKVSRR